MKKNKNLWIYPLIIMVMFLVVLNGCKKEEDKKNPEVRTKRVGNITATTATCGGEVTSDGGDDVTAYGVCWDTASGPTISDNKTTDGKGMGSYASAMAGLLPYTVYYVRAYAINSIGTGYGGEMSFISDGSSFTDPRDGKVYKTVTIGNQVWMAENLAYLPSVVGPYTGSDACPRYYVYGYDGTSVPDAKATANYTTYGVLYNWTAAMNSCPIGWHLPSDEEWTQLANYLGGPNLAGGKLKEIGTTHWNVPNTDATNEFGFTALPGGMREWDGLFHRIVSFGYWWTASGSSRYAYSWNMTYDRTLLSKYANWTGCGLSVRCIKD